MTTATATGVGLGVAAAAAFEISFVLQALEARRAGRVSRPRVSLLGRLVRRPLWALAIALSIGGFGLQVLALRHAPLSVVQPLLALGLVLLLGLSRVVLHERVGRRELVGVAGVIAGVSLVVLAAPARGEHADTTGLAIACCVLAAVVVAPFLRHSVATGPLVVSAAAGDALAALAINEVSRALLDTPLAALAWAALAAVAGLLALAGEAAALQHSPTSVVAPGVLAGQVAVPVLLAPLVVGDRWGETPGGGTLLVAGLLVAMVAAATLARSPAVGSVRGAGDA
jgi:drug/metabolite transporter (DMT)-like permease